MKADHNLNTPRDGPVLVIGAAGLDVVGHVKSELLPGISNPAYIRTTFGGVARNVAENLARLGQPVILVSAVGEDASGDQLLAEANEAGVNVERVLRTPQHPTGSYLAAVDLAGKLLFALDDMRAITTISPGYLRQQADLFRQASLLFVDANLPKDSLRAAMSLAHQARLPVCADPTSPALAERLRPYLARLYLTTPNFLEAAVFCLEPLKTEGRRQGRQAAKNLVMQGVQVAIVTLGELGLCYATSETSGYIPAIQTEVLDPTGAGDALTATVIFALLNDIPLDDAVRLAASAASLTLRTRGAVAPDLSLERLYDQLVI
jgi:pseudouridine kinase